MKKWAPIALLTILFFSFPSTTSIGELIDPPIDAHSKADTGH